MIRKTSQEQQTLDGDSYAVYEPASELDFSEERDASNCQELEEYHE